MIFIISTLKLTVNYVQKSSNTEQLLPFSHHLKNDLVL